MSNKTIFVLVLLVGAVVIGALVISGQKSAPQPAAPPPPRDDTGTKGQQSLNAAEAVKTKRFIDANPGPNATGDELGQYTSELVAAAARSATLNIGECKPVPGVLRVANGTIVTVVNPDSVERRIYTGQFDIKVAANSQSDYTFNLPSDGIYTYRCDRDLAGIVLQSEQ